MKKNKSKNEEFPGYPKYPQDEDIYNQAEETEIDPENINKLKTETNPDEKPSELDVSGELSGDDLDVPGSELDDDQEEIGSEDEENNFYSLGGDKD